MRRETKFFWAGLGVGAVLGAMATFSVLVLIALYHAGARGRSPFSSAARLEGQPAFDFEIEDVNPRSGTYGRSLRLSDLYRDGGVVVNFMASWCGPCRGELRDLQEIHAEGLARVVCVAADESAGPGLLLELAEEAGATLPLLFAPAEQGATLNNHYPHPGLPTTYLIDGNGTIRKVMGGARPKRKLIEEIAKAHGP